MYLIRPSERLTQQFAGNANGSYGAAGLKGHTACDYAYSWGEPVRAAVSGMVYSVINRNNPDPMKYRAVFQLVQDGTNWYEVSYGHLNEIHVAPGQYVNAGEIIGTAGNTGDVYQHGEYVTKDQKLQGSHAGTHLHGPQVRPVMRLPSFNGVALQDGYGTYRDDEGYYYQVSNYYNGYNGCVDPERFYTPSNLPSDQITDFAAKKMAMGELAQAKALFLVIAFLKSIGK